MNQRSLAGAGCSLLMAFMCGCASSFVAPKEMIGYWPYGQFQASVGGATPLDVQVCLNTGDRYRDLSHARSFPRLSPTEAHWYAEESKKFYNHVLRELEPQNAYAAISIGYVSLMQARVARSRKDRELALDAAYANLLEADRKRKGFAEAHVYLGELYALRKEWDKAINEFSSLASSGIEDSYIHAWWGYALRESGNTAEADAHFRKAIELGYPEQSASWARSQSR